MDYENNYLRLEKVKERIKKKSIKLKEIIGMLIEILDEEQSCNEGVLTEYDIVYIYELLTDEKI